MKLRFLGTGASHGIPVIGCNCELCQSDNLKDKRLRSSVLIETATQNLLIDVGPDFRQQMLRAKTTRIDAVLITHEHKDHTAGLDDVRAFNYLMSKPMSVFAEERVLESIKQEYSYVFADARYPGAPEFDLHEISNRNFVIGDDEVIPIRAFHNKLPIFGFKIGELAYLTDLKTIPDKEKDKLRNLDTLVISALRYEPHVSHFGFNEALELIQELSPKRAFLTHISHRLFNYNELIKRLPEHILPAYDGLVVEI